MRASAEKHWVKGSQQCSNLPATFEPRGATEKMNKGKIMTSVQPDEAVKMVHQTQIPSTNLEKAADVLDKHKEV